MERRSFLASLAAVVAPPLAPESKEPEGMPYTLVADAPKVIHSKVFYLGTTYNITVTFKDMDPERVARAFRESIEGEGTVRFPR